MTDLVLLNTIGYFGALVLVVLITHRTGTGVTFAHLFSLIWGPCILAAQVLTTSSYTLAPKTLAVLFGAWWALLAGGLLAIGRPLAITSREVMLSKRRAVALVFLLFVLQGVVTVYELPTISGQQDSINSLVITLRETGNATSARMGERGKVPWYLELFRGGSFVYLPLALLLRKRNWLSRPALYGLVVVTCSLALCRMTRAPLLANILTLWACWTLLYRQRALRAWGALVGGIVVFGVVFLTIQTILMRGQTRTVESVQLIEPYYGGSMRAFASILDGTFPREAGYYSADGLYYALHKVKMIDSYPSLIRPYESGTNIYTFLDAYALDGGVFGALLGAALTGAAGGWLFIRASRRHSPLMLTSYAMFAYCIAIAVSDNEFIRIAPVLTVGLAGIVNRLVVQTRAGSTLSSIAIRANKPPRTYTR